MCGSSLVVVFQVGGHMQRHLLLRSGVRVNRVLPSFVQYTSPLHGCHRTLFSFTPCYLGRRIKGRRSRHREPAEGDWLCQCGEPNYKSKRECFKCGAPAPPLPPGVRRPSLPGEDPHDWACPCGQMNFRGSVVCHKCQQPKPTPPPLPGKEVTLWTCPKCKGVNRNVRKFCFKCASPSPLLTFKPLV
ncbi:hypothetical protein TRVL_05137 [Trypanosoma vivax]|nr:hypothetical protein TRVL_05137 [Trypanosoma vivax]